MSLQQSRKEAVGPDIRSWLLQNQMSIYAENKSRGIVRNGSETLAGTGITSTAKVENSDFVHETAESTQTELKWTQNELGPNCHQTRDPIDTVRDEIQIDQALLGSSNVSTIAALERLVKQHDAHIYTILGQQHDQRKENVSKTESFSDSLKGMKRLLEKQVFQFSVAMKEFEDSKRTSSQEIQQLKQTIENMKAENVGAQGSKLHGNDSVMSEDLLTKQELRMFEVALTSAIAENSSLKENLIKIQEDWQTQSTELNLQRTELTQILNENKTLTEGLNQIKEDWKNQADEFRNELRQRKEEFKHVAEKYTHAKNMLTHDKKERELFGEKVNRDIEHVRNMISAIREEHKIEGRTNHEALFAKIGDVENMVSDHALQTTEIKKDVVAAVSAQKNDTVQLDAKLTALSTQSSVRIEVLQELVEKACSKIDMVGSTVTSHAAEIIEMKKGAIAADLAQRDLSAQLNGKINELKDHVSNAVTTLDQYRHEIRSLVENEAKTQLKLEEKLETKLAIVTELKDQVTKHADDVASTKDVLTEIQKNMTEAHQHHYSEKEDLRSTIKEQSTRIQELQLLSESHSKEIKEAKVVTLPEVEELREAALIVARHSDEIEAMEETLMQMKETLNLVQDENNRQSIEVQASPFNETQAKDFSDMRSKLDSSLSGLEELRSEVAALKDASILQTEGVDSKQECTILNKDQTELNATAESEMHGDMAELRVKLESLETKLEQLQNEVLQSHGIKDVEISPQTTTPSSAKLDELEMEFKHFKESTKIEITGVVDSNKKMLERLKEQFKGKENELQTTIEALNDFLGNRKGSQAELERKIDAWGKSVEKIERKLHEQKKELKCIIKDRAMMKSQLTEKDESVAVMNKALDESNDMLQVRQWENRGLHVTIANLKQKQMRYKQQFDQLIRNHTKSDVIKDNMYGQSHLNVSPNRIIDVVGDRLSSPLRQGISPVGIQTKGSDRELMHKPFPSVVMVTNGSHDDSASSSEFDKHD